MRQNIKQKILLLLLSGVTLGFSRSPKNYFKILEEIPKAWQDINRDRLYRAVHEFYNERIIDYKENDDIVKIVLTREGKKRALQFQIDEIKIGKPKKWDGIWRIVIFDVPEKKRNARLALRLKLKDLGFKELQKSVFIFPYECENEIDFIVEVFQTRSYVRFIRATSITNEGQFKIKFNLY